MIWIIILVSVLLYGKTLFYGRTIDDRTIKFDSNATFLQWISARKFRSNCHVRVFMVFYHTLNSVLVGILFGPPAGVLFAVLPANNQGGAWGAGQHYSLNTAAMLIALCIPVLTPFCWLLSMQTLPNVVFFPICFVFKWPITVLFLPILLLTYPLWFKHIMFVIKSKSKLAPPIYLEISARKFVFVVKTISYYFWLCLIGNRVGMYHEFHQHFGIGKNPSNLVFDRHSWEYRISLVTCTGILGVIVWFWGSPLSTGLIMWLVMLSMWSNFVTVQQIIADRYVYAANVFFVWALADALSRAPDVVAPFVIGYYFARTAVALRQYRNAWAMWLDNLMNFPNATSTYNAIGVDEVTEKNWIGAAYWFEKGLAVDPNNCLLLYKTASAALIFNDFELARSRYNRLKEALTPHHPENFRQLLPQLMHDIQSAEKKYMRGRKLIKK